MPCSYEQSAEEKKQDFEQKALFDSPASILLCEAMGIIEKAQLVEYCSFDLKKWYKKHTEDDRRKLEKMMQENKNESDKKAAMSKLTERERKLLGL